MDPLLVSLLTNGLPLIGVYKPLSPLGEGQYGRVWDCIDITQPKHRWALKRVPMKYIPELRNEVAAMAALGSHPNIVELKDVVLDETSVHLVMTLCRGGELFNELVRREAFSEAEAADIVWQLASALDHAHSSGVIHRDVKLENIFISQSLVAHNLELAVEGGLSSCRSSMETDRSLDTVISTESSEEGADVAGEVHEGQLRGFASKEWVDVLLGDWGHALFYDGKDGSVKPQDFAGSILYMSPEMVAGEPYEFGIDMWSVGVVLFALLSGLLPFTGSDDDVFNAIQRGAIDLNTSAWKGVSRAAKECILGLLQRDPSKRLTAKQLLRHPWVLANSRHERQMAAAHVASCAWGSPSVSPGSLRSSVSPAPSAVQTVSGARPIPQKVVQTSFPTADSRPERDVMAKNVSSSPEFSPPRQMHYPPLRPSPPASPPKQGTFRRRILPPSPPALNLAPLPPPLVAAPGIKPSARGSPVRPSVEFSTLPLKTPPGALPEAEIPVLTKQQSGRWRVPPASFSSVSQPNRRARGGFANISVSSTLFPMASIDSDCSVDSRPSSPCAGR
eukprot:TRINITY_DN5858_c0_g1_i1.p1 TRINITY_DN5858_c0_g1~~TRINITY_DN5858_c0_g1_i1.p1  ORF type:complete len:561 (-),score=77.22 TRINITY_DN5858_c0_g1_i1:1986-3668(-)